MIRRIGIRNYRSLRKVDLEPGLVNVFVGPNAAGKSNFLEALRFLTHVAGNGLSKAVGDRGGFPEIFWKGETSDNYIEFDLALDLLIETGKPPIPANYLLNVEGSQTGRMTVKREFLAMKHGEEFVTVIDMRSGHGEVKNLDGSKAFDPPADPSVSMLEFNIPNWAGTTFKAYLQLTHYYELVPRAMRHLKQFVKAPFLNELGDNLIEFLTTLRTAHAESFREIEQVVKDTFPEIEQLIPEPNQTGQVYLSSKEKFLKRPISVWNMAGGELVFIAFAAMILSPPEFGSPITCVEEPENHLHPRLLETLVELLRQAQIRNIAAGYGASQIFATTHSPYLVDRLKLDELVVVEKRQGETHYTHARDRKELEELLSREHLGLGELWFTGALGGV